MSSTRTFTVTSASSEYGNTFRVTSDGQTVDVSGERGIGLVVFEKDGKNPTTKKMFDCSDSSDCSSFCSAMEKIKDGSYVIMGIKGDVSKNLTSDCKRCITNLGSTEISRLSNKDSWAMMIKKGSPHTLLEYRKQDVVTFNQTF